MKKTYICIIVLLSTLFPYATHAAVGNYTGVSFDTAASG